MTRSGNGIGIQELQGIAGSLYAAHDGEPQAVAEAIQSHYLPRFAGDQLPGSTEASAVALADRVDTLVGIFGIGEPPTGSKDPFALRRASLGVIRILIERSQPLPLKNYYATRSSSILLNSRPTQSRQCCTTYWSAWAIGTTMREYISLLSEQCSQRIAPICLTLTSALRR